MALLISIALPVVGIILVFIMNKVSELERRVRDIEDERQR